MAARISPARGRARTRGYGARPDAAPIVRRRRPRAVRTNPTQPRRAGCRAFDRAAPAIGGYWTRSNDVEIDLVGADRQPVAKRLLFLGSIKWLETSPFDGHDLAALHRHRAAVTDAPVPLVAVSRCGVSCSGLQAVYGPEELLAAWRR